MYSFMFTVPLFLIYEIGIILTSSDNLFAVRNGADVLMRQILVSTLDLSTFGANGLYLMGIVFFIGFVSIYFLQRTYWDQISLNNNFLIIMFIESILWAIILFFMMSNAQILLMLTRGKIIVQQVTLAVGAGIYEEMLFRVILIYVISSILGFIFLWGKKLKQITAMVIAAGIFSLFHFIGDFGDSFLDPDWFNIFMIRFLAGIVLGLLYFARGFGITAWTHSVYDLIIVTRITTQ